MTLKKLFAAASLVALTAGSASALEIENVVTPAGPGGLVFATEVDLANNPQTGNFQFDLALTNGGNFPAGGNLDIVVTLPDGISFQAGLTGGAITPDVANGTPASSASLQSGGGVGSSTATFLVSIDNVNPDNLIGFDLPLAITGCPTMGSSITVTAALTGTTTFIENDVNGASTDDGLISCEDGKQFDVTSDENISDTVILLDDYNSVNDPVLGSINVTVDGTTSTDITGTPFVPGDIARVQFNVDFDDATGIAGVAVGGIPLTRLSPTSDRFVYNSNVAGGLFTLTDGIPDNITITPVGTDEGGVVSINATTVSVSDPRCFFGNPNLIAFEDGTGGALDGLQREGATFGFFDWNRGAGAAVNSVYRITGLTPGVPVIYTVEYRNSANNTVATGTITGDASGNARIRSRVELEDLNPGYDSADILLSFQTNNRLDVDRLIASAGGNVAPFGEGANVDNLDSPEPLRDGDNVGGPT